MKHETFLSADQTTTSHFICWQPVAKPIGTVQIIHGMAEYIERYKEFAEYLTGLGYVVVGHDHLGHGESSASGTGYFGKGDSVKLVLQDIDYVNVWIERHYPELPHFMLGHSMGSFALRNYLQLYQPNISGAILMGTGKRAAMLSFGLSVTSILNKTAPNTTNEWLDQLTFGDYSKRFPENGRFNWLSKNQENVSNYEADHRMGFTFTNNGFYTLFSLVDGATRKNWAHNVEQELPFLIISGEQDPVGDFGRGPRKVAKELNEAHVKDISLVLFRELRHEILFESEKLEVYKTISQWLNKRLNSNDKS
ncbi:alpha/beta fold hydrolase [Enterococcus sp. 5H]|uniref:alpha/beta fold hydrolase n=1 Tax=Enterococcus sp. 5H TaxID=1229490 RepID=UPI0023040DCA|nr:alpha/beta hydrolase [Enterococcus sp. 5H]MDA9472374.1 Lysophospholipase [Enterococcus sp. 5H]